MKKKQSGAASKKNSRRVQPAFWTALLGYGEALKRFDETQDVSAFNGCLLGHSKMADALIAIAWGADAREIFGQAGRDGRGSRGSFHSTVAYKYWHARCVRSMDSKAAATVVASWTNKYLNPLTPASVSRFARKFREAALLDLEVQGIKTSAVRDELNRHSNKGNAEWKALGEPAKEK